VPQRQKPSARLEREFGMVCYPFRVGLQTDTSSDGAVNIAAEIDALVDEYRTRCLWFLRSDYYPRSVQERIRVLDAIARQGDLAAYRRAARLKQWL
jgi:hypothetical protein